MDQELNYNYDELKEIISKYLFDVMKDIKIHKLNDGNMILDIDYQHVTNGVVKIVKEWKS